MHAWRCHKQGIGIESQLLVCIVYLSVFILRSKGYTWRNKCEGGWGIKPGHKIHFIRSVSDGFCMDVSSL